MTPVCSGCGLMHCDGRCYDESPPDEPERCKCGELLDDGECRICDFVMRELRATLELQDRKRA